MQNSPANYSDAINSRILTTKNAVSMISFEIVPNLLFQIFSWLFHLYYRTGKLKTFIRIIIKERAGTVENEVVIRGEETQDQLEIQL